MTTSGNCSTTQVLRQREPSPLGDHYDGFLLNEAYDDTVVFSADDVTAGGRQFFLYDAASGSARALMTGDPALSVRDNAHQVQLQVDAVDDAMARGGPAWSANGDPDCSHNPATGKEYTVYGFPPQPWEEGRGAYMRALVLSLTNDDVIPDGLVLFTCRLDIAADAVPGHYQLGLLRLAGSTSEGDAVDAVGRGGEVTVTDPFARALQPESDHVKTAGGCDLDTHSRDEYGMLLLLPAALLALRRVRSRTGAGVPSRRS